ncbi:MAG TPA: ATP-grasp domain-containing protein, partial [bacterium]|nr:ATP-grasp domain-containing protein [bacterium]
LSPGATPHYHKFCVELKKLGATVLGLGDEVYDQLHPDLKSSLTEFYRVNDLHHYGDLVRAMGYLTFKHGKIDRLDSLAEYWLETEAKLRTDFHIEGIKTDSIESIKRKSHMKRVFQKAGLEVARGEVLRSVEDVQKFVKLVGYPVIAKPDVGVGALGTFKIRDSKELETMFNTKPANVDYIFEEFIESRICTFDGLVDVAGQIVYCNSMIYSQGIMETVNDDLDVYYYTARDIPLALQTVGERIVRAFDLKARFFHFEFFKLSDDHYVPLEVNMRPPGGYTVDMFNYAADVDLYKAWAEIMLTGKTKLEYDRKYHAVYISRKSRRAYEHSKDQIMQKYGAHILNHVSVPGVFSSALGNEGYLYRADSTQKVLEAAEYIRQKY